MGILRSSLFDLKPRNRRGINLSAPAVRKSNYVVHVPASPAELAAAAERGDIRRRLGNFEFDVPLPAMLGQAESGASVIADLNRLPHLVLTGGAPAIRAQALANCVFLAAHAFAGTRNRLIVIGPASSPLVSFAEYADRKRLPVECHFGTTAAMRALKDMAAPCGKESSTEESSKILQPVGRLHWGAPRLAGLPALLERAGTDPSAPAVVQRASGDAARRMIIMDSLSGLLWLEGKSARDAVVAILSGGPALGMHVLAASSLLQVPPLGQFVDHELGGHWFFSAVDGMTPFGLFLGPGLTNAERFKHVKAANFGEGRLRSLELSKPSEDAVSIRELLAREEFFSPKITHFQSLRTSEEGGLFNELELRGLIARAKDGRWMPRVDAEHYWQSVSEWGQPMSEAHTNA